VVAKERSLAAIGREGGLLGREGAEFSPPWRKGGETQLQWIEYALVMARLSQR